MRAGDADRDAVLAVLKEAHANGRLDLDDISERQHRALAARYTDELTALVRDIPEGAALGQRWREEAVPHVQSTYVSRARSGWTSTVLSGRRIDLPAGASIQNFACLGGDSIYLRDALGPGVILTLDLPALCGGHTIYVPPGVRVVEETHGVLAGNAIQRKAQGDGANGTLVLRGWLVLAGHTVRLDKREV